jgi:hypothetical protein
MPYANQIQPDSQFFGLFIGRSGSGKSAAAYSFPHDSKDGILEVADLDKRVRGGLVPWISRDNFNFTRFSPDPKKTIFKQLNDYYETMEIMLGHGNSKIQTHVLDSGTWTANSLLLDALPLTHSSKSAGATENKGRILGDMNMPGPSDYGFQSTGMFQIINFLRTTPIKNVIVTAHIVNRWGRRKNEKGEIIDPYGPTEIVGEQLALTDKLAESLPSSFDHIFRFEKVDTGVGLKFYFEAQGELARTTFPIPYGRIDVTGKDFYQVLMGYAKNSPNPAAPTLAVVR